MRRILNESLELVVFFKVSNMFILLFFLSLNWTRKRYFGRPNRFNDKYPSKERKKNACVHEQLLWPFNEVAFMWITTTCCFTFHNACRCDRYSWISYWQMSPFPCAYETQTHLNFSPIFFTLKECYDSQNIPVHRFFVHTPCAHWFARET